MKKKKPASKSSGRKLSSSPSRGASSRSSGSVRRSSSRSTPQGYGSWFGDLEDRSETARYGHTHEGPRSSRYEDEGDVYGYGRSNRRSELSPSGRGGWFGDSEGHSAAARRGWQEGHEGIARSSRYEDEGYGRPGRSSGRSHGGHGGWFGDSEGHSQAAREGRGGRSVSRRDYEDEDYGSGRRSFSRYNEDKDEGYGRNRIQSDWFGDSEGHSHAARRR